MLTTEGRELTTSRAAPKEDAANDSDAGNAGGLGGTGTHWDRCHDGVRHIGDHAHVIRGLVRDEYLPAFPLS